MGQFIPEYPINVEVEEIVKPSLYAYRKQGIIEYENVWTAKILKISLYLDAYSITKNATIKTGVYTFAQIASWLLSAWALPTLATAKEIVAIIFGNALINLGLEIIGTKTYTGYVTEYTWKGVPSDTSRGTTGYLDGMKVDYKDKNGKSKTHTEGYQANAFSNRN